MKNCIACAERHEFKAHFSEVQVIVEQPAFESWVYMYTRLYVTRRIRDSKGSLSSHRLALLEVYEIKNTRYGIIVKMSLDSAKCGSEEAFS